MATTVKGWKRDKYGVMGRSARTVYGAMRLIADRAVTCDGSTAYEWYADEIATPNRRWSQGVRTYPTLVEAQAVADEWVRAPGAFTSVVAS